jgi:Methyltransferase domain
MFHLNMNIYRLYRPFFRIYRVRRLKLFCSLFALRESESILDVGGDPYFWVLCKKMGLAVPRVTILNLGIAPMGLDPLIKWVTGDARALPFPDMSFDYVFSNSVIEHVGDEQSQLKMAEEIRRVGRNYFVQTPDPRFPLELHLLTPFIHWLPRPLYERFVPRFTFQHLLNGSPEYDAGVMGIRLLSKKRMQTLFPEGKVLVERAAGWPKSLIAYRRNDGNKL